MSYSGLPSPLGFASPLTSDAPSTSSMGAWEQFIVMLRTAVALL